ncbi:MAG: hypothetical protein L7F78_03655, partial [Syntrophales bacterium LBB04]|nr:hypothetical protein [Syntrophales bacterium LBB04]
IHTFWEQPSVVTNLCAKAFGGRMQNDFLQVVDEAVTLELNISELYLYFYHSFPDDSDLWWKLALEEKNHGALLRSGREHFIKIKTAYKIRREIGLLDWKSEGRKMGKRRNHHISMVEGAKVLVAGFLLIFFIGLAQAFAADDCTKTYPNPVIKFDHKDAQGNIYVPVVNWPVYPNEMFRPAPDLPPCGANTNSSRTWVEIYNADTNARMGGFCAFRSNGDLKDIWVKPSTASGRLYIILLDRACKKSYRSNVISWGDDCTKAYPNPVIKFDHKDAQGNIYIPVLNWPDYPNEMFREAPDLPPCGANTNSSRTWVEIYNADTNARMGGFCAFRSNGDLKDIWVKPSTPSGRLYINLNDRACKKGYRSNTIAWQ